MLNELSEFFKFLFKGLGKILLFMVKSLNLWIAAVYSLLYLILCPIASIPYNGIAYLIGLGISVIVSLVFSIVMASRRFSNKHSVQRSGGSGGYNITKVNKTEEAQLIPNKVKANKEQASNTYTAYDYANGTENQIQNYAQDANNNGGAAVQSPMQNPEGYVQNYNQQNQFQSYNQNYYQQGYSQGYTQAQQQNIAQSQYQQGYNQGFSQANQTYQPPQQGYNNGYQNQQNNYSGYQPQQPTSDNYGYQSQKSNQGYPPEDYETETPKKSSLYEQAKSEFNSRYGSNEGYGDGGRAGKYEREKNEYQSGYYSSVDAAEKNGFLSYNSVSSPAYEKAATENVLKRTPEPEYPAKPDYSSRMSTSSETPKVFRTRMDPNIIIHEYSDKIMFYKETNKGLILLSTEQKRR